MTFPVTIRHRDSKVKIYAPAKSFGYYRVSYRIAGKRRMETFETYSEAKARAKKKVKEIANGSHAMILSARQSLDALAAIECLNKFYADTGRRFTLLVPRPTVLKWKKAFRLDARQKRPLQALMARLPT